LARDTTLSGFCQRTISVGGSSVDFRQNFDLHVHQGWNMVVARLSMPRVGHVVASLQVGSQVRWPTPLAMSVRKAVPATTNALMAATPVGLVVIAIAALAVGFVLAYNKLKAFYDAVNTAFVLLKARA
jgi:hypothetical protein